MLLHTCQNIQTAPQIKPADQKHRQSVFVTVLIPGNGVRVKMWPPDTRKSGRAPTLMTQENAAGMPAARGCMGGRTWRAFTRRSRKIGLEAPSVARMAEWGTHCEQRSCCIADKSIQPSTFTSLATFILAKFHNGSKWLP